jgi:hypothetical protein
MFIFWLLLFVLCFGVVKLSKHCINHNHNHKNINDTIPDNSTLEKMYQLQRIQGY